MIAPEWVDVPGLEGEYQASRAGFIRSVPREVIRSNGRPHTVRGRIIKVSLNTRGYAVIGVRGASILVHRLVALTFFGPPPRGHTDVNHKDGVRSNNEVVNLEWSTRSHNVLHGIEFLGSQSGAPGKKQPTSCCESLRRRSAKRYSVTSPGGELHSGNDLKAFCAERQLPYNTLLSLYHGVIQTTRLTSWRLIALSGLRVGQAEAEANQ